MFLLCLFKHQKFWGAPQLRSVFEWGSHSSRKLLSSNSKCGPIFAFVFHGLISASKIPLKAQEGDCGWGGGDDTLQEANVMTIRNFSLWGINCGKCKIKFSNLGRDTFPVWSEDPAEWKTTERFCFFLSMRLFLFLLKVTDIADGTLFQKHHADDSGFLI